MPFNEYANMCFFFAGMISTAFIFTAIYLVVSFIKYLNEDEATEDL
jgi:hypothetical protein